MIKILNCFKGKLKQPTFYNKFLYDFGSRNIKKPSFSREKKNLFKNDKLKIYQNSYFINFKKKYKIDDELIFRSFFDRSFLSYMNSTYCLMPFLFSNDIINAVL